MRVALVSREITPFSGGGIAPAVRAAADLLARHGHEVTIVTADDHRKDYEQRLRRSDPEIVGSKVQWAFVDRPPEDGGGYLSYVQAWSAAVYRTLRQTYSTAPDLIEFADYLGEGFATIQARHTSDEWLKDTVVAVRIHTTSEICAVLDGAVPHDHGARSLFEIERYCLKHADRVVYQGGDIYKTYERYYGTENLAPRHRIPYAALEQVWAIEPAPVADSTADDPLRILYLGRLERRKGVHDLVSAMDRIIDNVHVRMVGGDTDTGPLAAMVGEQLNFGAEGNPRIELAGSVPREQVAEVVAEADVVIVPSRWECWPNVILEALAANRPVLATPVGGMVEMVGDAGWLSDGVGPTHLVTAIERLARDPEAVRGLAREGIPRARFEHLVDPQRVLDGYAGLAAVRDTLPVSARLHRQRDPLVSVIIPYFELAETLPATLASLADQDYSRIETVIVNDGSLRDADRDLWDLASRYGARVVTQPNAGLSAARNFGIAVARGEYILPLDADDEINPDFVSRCVRALESDPALAYVTSYVAYVDEDGVPHGDEYVGYFPMGNWSSMMDELNVAGTCSSLFRRGVFRDHRLRYSTELASYEDWGLYRRMAVRGLHGAVIPEQLFRYRVRRDSMTRQDAQPHLDRLLAELRADDINDTMQWEAVPRA